MTAVAVALALYKPERSYLAAQLASLAQQKGLGVSFQVLLYVRDDSPASESGSIPQSEFQVLAFEAGISPESIRWIAADKRVGAVRCFAELFTSIATDIERGETSVSLVFPCDQDDIWEAHKIQTMLQTLLGPGLVMAVHSDLSLIDESGRPLAPSVWALERRDPQIDSAEALIHRNSVTGCAMGFRTEVLRRALPFPEQGTAHPPLFYHDVWLAICALSLGQVVALPETLVRYRQHGRNAVGAERRQSPMVGLAAFAEKAHKALVSRQVLEDACLARPGVASLKLCARSRFDLGMKYIIQTIALSLTRSTGYLKIGLLLAAGKCLADLRCLRGTR